MTLHYDQMTVLRIAKYYYLDGLSQQEISEKENIHRSQISRILKMAREMGYVQIHISAPDSFAADSLARRLESGLNLREVFVTPSLSSQAAQDESLYFFAARHLEEVLPHCKNIGIGLGKTLYHVAAQLTAQTLEEQPEFFGVAGTSGTDTPYLQSSVLLDNFARPFHGHCHYNNFPIFVECGMMSPLDQKRHAELQEAYRKLDTVVLSVGEVTNTNFPYLEECSRVIDKNPEILQSLARQHGNLLGHVFYENHEVLELPRGFLMSGMDLLQLRNVPNVICIANGKQKVEPIISASLQGYIKSLITDEPTAQSILQKIEPSPEQ
jgi:deoxyribonucleoside regulator